MIYTVTFSPSLDYVVKVKDFKMGMTNRTEYETIRAGGKGINVSIVLNNLSIENVAMGFCGGFTGEAILNMLKAEGLKTKFIETEGLNRINVKLKTDVETEINGQGVKISKENYEALIEEISRIKRGDILVLAGTVPKTLPDDIYEKILNGIKNSGAEFVVDATGDLLKNVLKYKPFLIKPNKDELAELFSANIKTDDDIVKYAKRLQSMGAKNAIVSMGKNGAIMVTEEGEVFKTEAPDGKVVDTVGSGDSLVAGFLAGYLRTGNKKEALLQGIAAGSASAFKEGLAVAEEIEFQRKRIK